MKRRTGKTALGRLSRALLTVAIVATALIGVLAHTAAPAAAVGSYNNASIADIALGYVGQPGVNACNAAGHPGLDGQCKNFANCIVAMASGGTQWPAPGYSDGFANAGGQEVARGDATKGDVIQIGPNDPSGVLHTAIVVSNLGNGSFDVVDSNWGYTEMVNHHTWNPPAGARFWRMGTVNTSPPPPPPKYRKVVLRTDGVSGYALKGEGTVTPFGGAPAVATSANWGDWDIARDIALRPDGVSGYVLDGWGGLHEFGGAPHLVSSAIWNGWDIARRLVLRPDGVSGYVLDGWGGLHEFGGAPHLESSTVWNGWDIARGVVLRADGVSGYVLDGLGGLHEFGGAPPIQVPTIWNWDIARDVVLSYDESSGYVLEGYGGLHEFGGAPPPTESGYHGGTDTATGAALALNGRSGYVVDADGSVHAFTAPGYSRKVAVRSDGVSGYVLRGNGSIAAFGGAPAVSESANWGDWDIARDIALRPDGVSGYVLDGWGGLHEFGGAPHLVSSAIWNGWDIARRLVLRPDGVSGYVLDGWGGLHEFGGAPHLEASTVWVNWDIARGVVLRADGVSGYVLDGLGGLHEFGGAPPIQVPTIWNWDIARGLILLSDGVSGYVLDGLGGLHEFGSAVAIPVGALWSPWDVVPGVAFAANAGKGVTVDISGLTHPFQVGPPAPVVPGAPSGVVGVAGDGAVSLAWPPPASDGGSPVTGYLITVSPGGAIKTVGNVTSASVSGLSNGTAYTFTVRAVNVVGTGPASVPSAAVTPVSGATVPGVPTGVAGVAGNVQATVSWTAPASNGGSAITGYTVTVSPGGATKTVGVVTSTSVTGLSNGTAYTFTVKAINAVGTGLPSVPSAAVTPRTVPGAPTAVTAFGGNGQATVSWTAPASNGGSAITGYTVTVSPGGTTKTVGAVTSTTVTGLTNGTAYSFTVKATNVAGTGAASAASNSVKPMTVPGAPTGVSAAAGNGAALVAWTGPLNSGGSPVTGYVVTASPGGATKTVGAVTSVTFDGLANGTAYTFTVQSKNAVGLSVPSAASTTVTPVEPGGKFHPLAPGRILDSRDGIGGHSTPWGAGQARDLQITGAGGVPEGATAVVLNVTVTAPSASSHLTLWPAANTMPTASNLNFTPGLTVANLTVTQIGWQGRISIYNNSGTVHVIADVVGYYDDGTDPTGVTYTGVTPTRLLDTRDGTGGFNTPWGPGESRPLLVRGTTPVPSTATAVVVNMTVTGGTATSHLTVWPGDQTRPVASNLNFAAGNTRPNLVVVKLGGNGTIGIYNNSGSVHVIADVVGYYDTTPTAGTLHPMAATRILDSREGTGGYNTPWGPATIRPLTVAGGNGIPPSAKAVIINITVTGPTAPSHLTAWPTGQTLPTASNLNWSAGQTVPNLAIIKLGPDGGLNLHNNTGTVHIIADIVGYYT